MSKSDKFQLGWLDENNEREVEGGQNSSEDRNIFKTELRPGKMGERKERK